MNIHNGFIKDICTNPYDDIPRLIYADWLQDNGEEARAEFIRLQIKLKTIPKDNCKFEKRDCNPDCKRCKLKKRQLELHTNNWAKWWPKELDSVKIFYTGGFVEIITLTCDNFINLAKEIFSFCPIKKVILKDKKPVIVVNNNYYWYAKYCNIKESYTLPKELFRLMLNDGEQYASNEQFDYKKFDDKESALSCLNNVCLLHGRRLVWPCPKHQRNCKICNGTKHIVTL